MKQVYTVVIKRRPKHLPRLRRTFNTEAAARKWIASKPKRMVFCAVWWRHYKHDNATSL